MTHAHPHPPHPCPSGDHAHAADDQAELLDLEAEALAAHFAEVAAWLPYDVPPRTVVDLGCGTGAGTFALAARFPGARIVAVDSSAAHLARLTAKARAEGVAERVRTVRADLDAGLPDLGTPDLVWASGSLHHLADPDRVLRDVRAALAPGGLLAVVELAGFPRFLPPDAPEDRPGLEERCHAALARGHAERLPHRGADWGPKLAAAGFTVEAERTLTVHVAGAGDGTVGRFALAAFQRFRAGVAGQAVPAEDALPADGALTTDDLAALDRLLDTGSPYGIPNRDDLAVRTERTVWAARAR